MEANLEPLSYDDFCKEFPAYTWGTSRVTPLQAYNAYLAEHRHRVEKLTSRPNRISFDELWLGLAWKMKDRSTCSHLHVGAVLVSEDNQKISVGYNGVASGEDHCNHQETEATRHSLDEPTCDNTLHAELNAIVNCDWPKVNSTLYVTHSPCWQCAGFIINARITRVVYSTNYRITIGLERLRGRGITVVQQARYET